MKDVPRTTTNIADGTSGAYATIVSNSNEGATPTPTILKVKHVRSAVDLYLNSTMLNGGFICLMYLPQGITPDANTPLLHPEWVMAWKGINIDSATGHNQVLLSSTLSRNLNSGDSIVYFYSFYNGSGSTVPVITQARVSCVVRKN